MAIKGKDLSYEAQEPAFLRRLRAQQAGHGDPDRHERPIARPTRMKTANADDDDVPTIVDEENNRTLSKSEYEALLAEEASKEASVDETGQVESIEDLKGVKEQIPVADERLKQEVTQAGQAQKKRKAIKVVGADDIDSADTMLEENTKKPKFSTSKSKRKAKAVALSFGDGDG